MANERENQTSSSKPGVELLSPEGPWRIDEPDFKATEFKDSIVQGRQAKYSQCYEFVGGKWEGFVSIKFTECKNEKQG